METIDWNDKEQKREYMRKYCKKYYQDKKDVLCSKVKCDCGKVVNFSSLKNHIKTPYHKNRMMNKDEYIEMKTNKVLNKSI